MIMKHVEQQLLPRPVSTDTEPIKELNLVMDNCGGQNKNRHVLCLLNVIVQRNIAKRVNAIFLVKGHTKNPCNRMFNLLKKDTRKDNIYSPTMLFDALNRQEVCMHLCSINSMTGTNGKVPTCAKQSQQSSHSICSLWMPTTTTDAT